MHFAFSPTAHVQKSKKEVSVLDLFGIRNLKNGGSIRFNVTEDPCNATEKWQYRLYVNNQ